MAHSCGSIYHWLGLLRLVSTMTPAGRNLHLHCSRSALSIYSNAHLFLSEVVPSNVSVRTYQGFAFRSSLL
jgi:hypothetical protein